MVNGKKENCPNETFCFNCPSCGDVIEIKLVLGEKRSCPCGMEFQAFLQKSGNVQILTRII